MPITKSVMKEPACETQRDGHSYNFSSDLDQTLGSTAADRSMSLRSGKCLSSDFARRCSVSASISSPVESCRSKSRVRSTARVRSKGIVIEASYGILKLAPQSGVLRYARQLAQRLARHPLSLAAIRFGFRARHASPTTDNDDWLQDMHAQQFSRAIAAAHVQELHDLGD
jgi:hypothetical protein